MRLFTIGSTAVRVLKGHTQKVFNVAWSPLIPGCLASTSDDCTARIWFDTTGSDAQDAAVLVGHTSKVRAVLWHPEFAHILHTGAPPPPPPPPALVVSAHMHARHDVRSAPSPPPAGDGPSTSFRCTHG